MNISLPAITADTILAKVATLAEAKEIARDMRLGGDFVFVRYGHELHVFANQ